jgi:hypothetical protein
MQQVGEGGVHLGQGEDLLAGGAVHARGAYGDQLHVPQALAALAQRLACPSCQPPACSKTEYVEKRRPQYTLPPLLIQVKNMRYAEGLDPLIAQQFTRTTQDRHAVFTAMCAMRRDEMDFWSRQGH